MSYDVWLTIDTGAGERVEVATWNYTSNCSRMWTHALNGTSLRDLHERNAGEVAPTLAAAVERMKSDPLTYKAMNPGNGWGDSASATEFLASIAEACAMHPNTVLHVHS